MRVLYLECSMGASGDMLMGALSELVDQNIFLQKMKDAGIEGITVTLAPSMKCGIMGTHAAVKVNGEEEHSEDIHHDKHEHLPAFDHDHDDEHHEHHHHHASMSEIESTINALHVSDLVKKNALEVYHLLAEAESRAHQVPVSEIHFHEVGMKDAVADIVGSCILMEMIGADKVYAGRVAVGSGMVKCAHGILPVPAPATAYLLQGIPTSAGIVEAELCTPTGAALLKHFVDSFDGMPEMSSEKIGCGTGRKDFSAANVLRAFLGEETDHGEVVELTCNLDDQSPEEIGHAMEVLFAEGALDVYTVSALMKKNRPGLLFTCTCRDQDKDRMLALMFEHLTTLGIRENKCRRHALTRHIETVSTSMGDVRLKVSSGYGIEKEKIEYDDLAAIADQNKISIAEVRRRIEKERKK